MTPTQTPTKIEWYTKEEAGIRLGTVQQPMSTRRVLELAKAGKFQSDRFLNPNTGQMNVRIHAGSLERYLDERKTKQPIPGMTPPPAPWTAGDALTKRLGELVQLTNLLRNGAPNADGEEQTKRPVHLWLTLQEAVNYSGLPIGILVEFIASGRLPALDVGRHRRGGRWRIRQTDLRRLQALPK